MVKNFKNLLFWNQGADDLETWHTASGSRVLPMFSYDDPGLTLTIFMTGSNLFPNASAWVKAYTASGERYRTNVLWVSFSMDAFCIIKLLLKDNVSIRSL